MLVDFEVQSKIQSTCTASDSAIDGVLHNNVSFVANVNVDSGKLKAYVNRFDNSNVWNADNRHRVVVPKLVASLVLNSESFLFYTYFPTVEHSANSLEFIRQRSILFIRQAFIFPS